MLYGTDYRSASDLDERRLLRRFRRDVMFLSAQTPEVVAAGLIAGLAVVPLLLVTISVVTFLFSFVFSGAGPSGPLPAGAGLDGLPDTPDSRGDFLLLLATLVVTLVTAGGLSAALRRYDYKRHGGLRYYLHHPRSPLGMAGFFVPITLLTVGGLLIKAAQTPHISSGRYALAVHPSLVDRGVLYLFLGLLLSMLLYLVWENLFPAILPTLSNLDVDGEVARRQREDRARILAEEDRMRSRW